LPDAEYYWRVRAVDSDGTKSEFSETRRFAIIPTFGEWVVISLAAAMMAYVYMRGRSMGK
jgi:hypothetical protein